jgi:hypothetical protein
VISAIREAAVVHDCAYIEVVAAADMDHNAVNDANDGNTMKHKQDKNAKDG